MPLSISKPALIVIDMQEHFREIAEGITPRVNAAIDLARSLNMPVYYSQHGHQNPAEDHNHNVLVAYLGPSNSIKKDSPAYQLLPEVNLDPAKDTKISKDVYDAFLGKPDLAQLLREKGLNGLIVNLCCQTTSRAAVCRGYGIVFVRDANAAYSKAMHDATLQSIEFGFGEAITLDEIKRRIN